MLNLHGLGIKTRAVVSATEPILTPPSKKGSESEQGSTVPVRAQKHPENPKGATFQVLSHLQLRWKTYAGFFFSPLVFNRDTFPYS